MSDDLIARMAQALRMHGGCLCTYQRTATGVPMWFPSALGGIERKLVKECSVCAILAEYERQYGVEIA